uniref:Putative RNA-dependent RNA polymerase 5 n=1 Tax=Rhizophora mucronata TaxID=61149 RepID=A0A2P2JAH0_RHIMU
MFLGHFKAKSSDINPVPSVWIQICPSLSSTMFPSSSLHCTSGIVSMFTSDKLTCIFTVFDRRSDNLTIYFDKLDKLSACTKRALASRTVL